MKLCLLLVLTKKVKGVKIMSTIICRREMNPMKTKKQFTTYFIALAVVIVVLTS